MDGLCRVTPLLSVALMSSKNFICTYSYDAFEWNHLLLMPTGSRMHNLGVLVARSPPNAWAST